MQKCDEPAVLSVGEQKKEASLFLSRWSCCLCSPAAKDSNTIQTHQRVAARHLLSLCPHPPCQHLLPLLLFPITAVGVSNTLLSSLFQPIIVLAKLFPRCTSNDQKVLMGAGVSEGMTPSLQPLYPPGRFDKKKKEAKHKQKQLGAADFNGFWPPTASSNL